MSPVKTLVTVVTVLSLSFANLAMANTATSAKMDDSSITSTVKNKMHANKSLGTSKIMVTTKEGIVMLTGDAKTHSEASAAIELAQSVPGVKDVNTSELKVEGSAHPVHDAYITSKVKGIFLRDKLFGDKPISVTGIHVETKDGIVHLTGKVENEAQAKSAEELAKTVKDVKAVESSIKVK